MVEGMMTTPVRASLANSSRRLAKVDSLKYCPHEMEAQLINRVITIILFI
jgi:hypothetical protein